MVSRDAEWSFSDRFSGTLDDGWERSIVSSFSSIKEARNDAEAFACVCTHASPEAVKGTGAPTTPHGVKINSEAALMRSLACG